MAVTLQDLRDSFYAILREEQDTGGGTSAYPLVLCDTFLNDAQNAILAGRCIHPINLQEARKGEIYSQKAHAFYKNIVPTTLTTGCAIGDTTLHSDTTGYPAIGTLYIAGDVIPYTSITPTTFVGCTNVLFAFVQGTQVNSLIVLPADYSSVVNVTYKNKIRVPAVMYNNLFEQLNDYKGTSTNRAKDISFYDQPYRIQPFYTILDAQYLLLFNYMDADAEIMLRYEKLPAPMVLTTDPCSITNDTYAKLVIPMWAAGSMLYFRGEEQRAGSILSYALSKIREMYDWYNSTDYEHISGIHYQMGKGHLNI